MVLIAAIYWSMLFVIQDYEPIKIDDIAHYIATELIWWGTTPQNSYPIDVLIIINKVKRVC